jgi:haloalkane dehalogenase
VELVWGRKDPLLGGALPRHVRALPRARVTETDAGHFLQEEVPDIIARSIRRLAGMQEAP